MVLTLESGARSSARRDSCWARPKDLFAGLARPAQGATILNDRSATPCGDFPVSLREMEPCEDSDAYPTIANASNVSIDVNLSRPRLHSLHADLRSHEITRPLVHQPAAEPSASTHLLDDRPVGLWRDCDDLPTGNRSALRVATPSPDASSRDMSPAQLEFHRSNGDIRATSFARLNEKPGSLTRNPNAMQLIADSVPSNFGHPRIWAFAIFNDAADLRARLFDPKALGA